MFSQQLEAPRDETLGCSCRLSPGSPIVITALGGWHRDAVRCQGSVGGRSGLGRGVRGGVAPQPEVPEGQDLGNSVGWAQGAEEVPGL